MYAKKMILQHVELQHTNKFFQKKVKKTLGGKEKKPTFALAIQTWRGG